MGPGRLGYVRVFSGPDKITANTNNAHEESISYFFSFRPDGGFMHSTRYGGKETGCNHCFVSGNDGIQGVHDREGG